MLRITPLAALALALLTTTMAPAAAADVPGSLAELKKVGNEISDPNFKAMILSTHANLEFAAGMQAPTIPGVNPIEYMHGLLTKFAANMSAIDSLTIHDALRKGYAPITASVRALLATTSQITAAQRQGGAPSPGAAKAMQDGLAAYAAAMQNLAPVLESIRVSMPEANLPAADQAKVRRASELVTDIQRSTAGPR